MIAYICTVLYVNEEKDKHPAENIYFAIKAHPPNSAFLRQMTARHCDSIYSSDLCDTRKYKNSFFPRK